MLEDTTILKIDNKPFIPTKLIHKLFFNSKMKVLKFLIILLIPIICSCDDDHDKNPADYELYISISSDKYPSISPDGTQIAFYHKCIQDKQSAIYPTGLYIQNMDGTNKRLLIEGDHFNPDWSPDCKWITFSSAGVLRIINVKGDSIRTFNGLDNALHSPDWSMDGEKIIVSAPLRIDGGVFEISPDFLSIKRILNPITNNGMYASWSPDRSKIVYIKGSKSLKSVEIFTSDTALLFEKQLTSDNRDDRSPKWSPDGGRITWSSNVIVMIMDIEGENRKSLDFGNNPSWSPNSDYIIYSNANIDFTKEVLWKINIDGSERTQLTY